ncbi:helix-turn-helix transcriptional regulator [Ralstonia pseudosolanacearum]|uniref:winged helix-turn-helix transcriptional regulator n=1 Tax=Ralstonia pseudosolanacearum TaxID=1310165 RepID=UPI00200561B8|nr:helix-turn-helix domain-containing protein [Ralstonia pseudosolanacearum]MCK4141948.1 helix-turn-helix transcriptional regulator [Ralstonia pseudosolanacearum]
MDVTTQAHELENSDCQKISQVLARVGEKWSVLIIMLLSGGPRRFTEVKRAINGISQRMLTLCLRGLERDGLIKRTVVAVMPPHVQYELTPLGRSLTEPVIALGTWAREHIADIDIARAEFDVQDEAKGSATPWQR